MKLNRYLALSSVIALLLFSACKKNQSDEQYIENTTPVTPDLSIKINTTVAGFITDENNEPVSGAQVSAGVKQATTDEYGYFKISNALLPKIAAFVIVSKAGYFKNLRTFTGTAGKESFLRIKMLTKKETGTIDAASGGTVSTSDGGKVTLPANGVVTASNNSAYSGQVHVSARLIDLAAATDMQLSAPGDGRGIDKDGHLKLLKSYATIIVELTGNAGEKLQVAANKQATLVIPVSSASAAAPATVPLWSLDEATGFWKQESTAVRSGNIYTGNVSHFSFWDGADPTTVVNFTAQVVNTALQPLANVAVSITVAGQPVNSGYSHFGFTDANGFVNGAVPANANLVLDILTPCAIAAYSHNFSTTNSNIDLGTLTGNLGQNVINITGNVTNCSNQPVTDGYVQTYDHGFYNRFEITSGAFNFTGLACTNITANYIAVDRLTNQQSTPQSTTFVPGTNNLGTLSACGTSSIGSITYTIDGNTKTVTEPADTLATYFLTPQYTAIVQLSRTNNGSPQITFQFDGGTAIGSAHTLTDIWFPEFPSGRGYAPVPLTMNITEYGSIGGFVSGNFSGMVLDFGNNSIHNINCSFRIKRFN